MGRVLELVELKSKIIDELGRKLSSSSISLALRDSHSRRKPRPCGITIHTGVGCNLRCSYCYIYDMGFPAQVRSYPLKPLELVYALARNPYVVPTKTFAAYGSVTEPFLPETRDKALSYIGEVYRSLELPSQVSTKIVIDNELAKALRELEPRISILVTVVTIEYADKLERFAPSPIERIRGIATASQHNLFAYLFVRPVIPGITDRELEKIIKLGTENSARGVVFGSLRITNSIIDRLKAIGINVHEIVGRAPKKPSGREQVPIKTVDIIKRGIRISRDYGLKPFRAACMANVDSHDEYCAMCELGPCGNKAKRPPIEYNDVAEYLEHVGVKYKSVEVDDDRIEIVISRGAYRELLAIKTTLAQISRRTVVIGSA